MLKNRIAEFEKDICSILSQLAYHIHPKIIRRIQDKNREQLGYFAKLFSNKIKVEDYLFEESACVFPGVRRYVSGKGKKRSYNASYKAIIDDNTFPRHIWSYLRTGAAYSGPKWQISGLGEFELAHIFTHKESEVEFEKAFFSEVDDSLMPYGDFSCACNVILLPKGTVRPTDNSPKIKTVFYKRYVSLYGEKSLNGRHGFKESLVPDWYSELIWNDPFLPQDWEENLEKLLDYRTTRITHLLGDLT